MSDNTPRWKEIYIWLRLTYTDEYGHNPFIDWIDRTGKEIQAKIKERNNTQIGAVGGREIATMLLVKIVEGLEHDVPNHFSRAN